MRKVLFLILFILVLSGCGSKFEPVLDWKVGDFEYIDQNNETVSLEDLKGDIWLSTFIFTNCNTVCPPMTYNLVDIEQKLLAEGITDVKIVPLSVDPEVDTPEVLKEYSSRFDIKHENWHLLTGYTQDEITEFAREYFKAIVQDDKKSDQVIHDTKFYLVDRTGTIVKSYSGVNDVPYEEIVEDIKLLSKDQ